MAGSCCEHISGDVGFRKIWGISTLAEVLVAYQKVPPCIGFRKIWGISTLAEVLVTYQKVPPGSVKFGEFLH